jgi:hypothetical protein
MAVKTSLVPDVKDAIVDGLVARPAVWSDVQVLTEPTGDMTQVNHFHLTDEASDRSVATFGGALTRITEAGHLGFELTARVDGSGEETTRSARDLAYARLADLDGFIAVSDYDITGAKLTTLHVDNVTGAAYLSEDTKGRIHELKGTIGFSAILTPGG